jgi:hypothetical protein
MISDSGPFHNGAPPPRTVGRLTRYRYPVAGMVRMLSATVLRAKAISTKQRRRDRSGRLSAALVFNSDLLYVSERDDLIE